MPHATLHNMQAVFVVLKRGGGLGVHDQSGIGGMIYENVKVYTNCLKGEGRFQRTPENGHDVHRLHARTHARTHARPTKI